MKAFTSARILSFLVAVLLGGGAAAASKVDLEAAMAYDGLQKINVRGIDMAYARPGASLADYDGIILEPVDVAFHKNWDPSKGRSSVRLTAADRESIKTGVAKVVYDAFASELQGRSSYQLVNEPGPNVLRVKVKIVNLYANAPDTRGSAATRTYTVSAGEMTLFAELYDSETGEILARVVDRRESRRAGGMTVSNSVVNADEARTIAADWARILRGALDRAHAIGKK